MQTTPKRKPTTGSTKIGDLAYSTQSSALTLSSGNPDDPVPGISTVINTQGRPVLLLLDKGSIALSHYGAGLTGTLDCTFDVKRNGVSIGTWVAISYAQSGDTVVGGQTFRPFLIDRSIVGTPGEYTYTLHATKSGLVGTADITDYELLALEL